MNNILPIVLFATAASLTPGPNNLMIMNSGLNHGLKKSLPHYLGISFGFPIMLLLMAFGLGSLLIKYPLIKQVLQIIGSIYLAYLAWQILRSYSKSNAATISNPLSFLQATLFQWVNPKAWLLAISTISIFTISSNYIMNAALLSLITCIVCLYCTAAWLVFGGLLQQLLKKEKQLRWFNIAMAISLFASIFLVFF